MFGPGLFRFILALLVVAHHITRFVFLGGFAVFAFFILSGYWVTKMYEEKYNKARSPISTFYVSRVWRLLPVYILASLCALPFLYYYRPAMMEEIHAFQGVHKLFYFLANATLLGYNVLNPKIIGSAWSLDIEMQYYLVLPLLVLCIRYTPIRLLTWISLAVSVFLLFQNFYGLQYSLLKYLPFFLIGMQIYKGECFLNISARTSLILFAALLLIHYVVPSLYANTAGDKHSLYCDVFNYLLTFTIIPFIRANVQYRSNPNDKKLGDLSYIIYLFHWVFYIPYAEIVKNSSYVKRSPYLLAYLLITMGVSWLVYSLFDRKIDKIRSKWVSRRIKLNKKTAAGSIQETDLELQRVNN